MAVHGVAVLVIAAEDDSPVLHRGHSEDCRRNVDNRVDVGKTGADCILIANDEVVQDELRMTAIRMSKPNGVKLVMKSVEDSIKASISDIGRDAPRRVMARYFTPTWGKVNFPTDSIRVP